MGNHYGHCCNGTILKEQKDVQFLFLTSDSLMKTDTSGNPAPIVEH
jgi:hypothetical protein